MKYGQESAAEPASDTIQIESLQVLFEFHQVVNRPDYWNWFWNVNDDTLKRSNPKKYNFTEQK